ncbi:MAG: efflux RND transporter periplasmic adaptor subunit [Planctomycetaceae bacterium]
MMSTKTGGTPSAGRAGPGTRHAPWCRALVLVGLVAGWSAPATGHEGHQPLPTRGVEVNLEKGRVALSAAARDLLDVRTVEVRSGRHVRGVRAYTTIVAPWTGHALVASRLPGRVVTLSVRPGETVTRGQLLAEIDSLELQTLQRDVIQAQAELTLARELVATLTPAARAGAVAGQKLAEAQNTLRQTEGTLAVLRAKSAGLGLAPEWQESLSEDERPAPRLKLTSPINGTIVHADLAVGQFVELTEHLFEIVDTSLVWARVEVVEPDLRWLAVGQEVRLEFPATGGEPVSALIDTLGSMLDPQTQQAHAWATLDNAGRSASLLPGMKGQALLRADSAQQGLLVPESAVFSDGAERFLLIETSRTRQGSEYRRRPVVLAGTFRGEAQVVGGQIVPGDRVVTRGGHELAGLFFQGTLRVGPETARNIGLTVEPVRPRVVESIVTLEGRLEIPPQQRTLASSPLAGSLKSIHVDRGQAVAAGEVVAEVESLELQDLQLELLRAHLDRDLWEETWSQLNATRGSVPRRTLLELQSRGERLATDVASLRQKLTTLGLTREQVEGVVQRREVLPALPVRAPIAGLLADFDRVLGQMVRADEPLFEIHDVSQARVQVAIPVRESSRIAVGQHVRLRLVASPELVINGRVERLGPVVAPGTRSVLAWVDFERPVPVRLQHNLLARVTVTTARPAAVLAVPLPAVVRDGARSFVFRQNPDGTFERRLVQTGRADDRFIEVLAGVGADDPVAVGGVPQLQAAYAAIR